MSATDFDPRLAALNYAARVDGDRAMAAVNALTCGLVYVGDQIARVPEESRPLPRHIHWILDLTVDEIEALDDGMAYFAMSDYSCGEMRPFDEEQEAKREAARSAIAKIQAVRGEVHGSE